jgi:phosphonate transport system substrate-binding protein
MKARILIVLVLLLVLAACQSSASRLEKANRDLGSKKNPIKMYFVPSLEAGKVVSSGEAIASFLHQETGYYFKVAVPTSYAAVIEALGSYQADIAWLATYAYVLAHEKYDAEVQFMTVRNGLKNYRGQFVALANGNVKSIEDIEGKIIAYTDAASTSGYIYPSAILKQKGITPRDMILAGSHNAAILAVYSGRADVGCSYWSPDDSTGRPKDAREKLLDTHPDVIDKVAIIGFTDWIPNDTVTFRNSLPEEVRTKVHAALLKFSGTDAGVQTLRELYDIDGLVPATDADYNIVRETLSSLGMNPADMLK